MVCDTFSTVQSLIKMTAIKITKRPSVCSVRKIHSGQFGLYSGPLETFPSTRFRLLDSGRMSEYLLAESDPNTAAENPHTSGIDPAMAPAAQKKSHPFFLEVLCHTLIILCTTLSIVLSSIAVCDGHWLLSERHTFGLWFFCDVDTANSGAPLNCSRHVGEEAGQLLEHGLGLCRCVVCLAVVSAIFGLELLVLSQVSEGPGSMQRWRLGAWLVLLAAGLAAAGAVTFVFLVWDFATPSGLTLTFWCQFTATFLFFLNGMAARHIQSMEYIPHSSGDVWKP